MRLVLKTACFLLFFSILISPVFSQSVGGEEPHPDDSLFFFEELFLLDDFFSFDESSFDEEAAVEEELLAEEIQPENEEIALEEAQEDLPVDKEIALEEAQEDLSIDKEIASEETQEDLSVDKEIAIAEEDEDYFDPDDFDEDAFFFEAPQLVIEVPTYEIRTIEKIFPNLSTRQKMAATNGKGWRNSFLKDEIPSIVPNPELGIDLLGSVLKRKPSHLIEALVIVPYNEKEFDLLDVYNAIGRISKIKDAPVVINGRNYHAFTESSRIESTKRRRDIPDPLPAKLLPFSETIYLRIKEVNFGNLFIRGDLTLSMYGMTYNMTNFTAVRYFLVPVVNTERFSAVIYAEPVKEGVLIYCMSGFYIPGFIADKVDLTPNINRRIEIFINWITEGLKYQESEAQ